MSAHLTSPCPELEIWYFVISLASSPLLSLSIIAASLSEHHRRFSL
ncbi:hypothetical protein BVRB_6g138200 [Beta vulgaris subsp. vulgaris]|nr:hypothetical protein BVRB_6g138200 [Beta vulgaris subsp. vulgaris]